MSPASASVMSTMLVGVHADQPADLDLLARAGVDDLGALLDPALVDPDVGQLAVGAVLELEGEQDGGLGRVGLELDLRALVVEVEGDVADLGRVGQVADDTVEQGLDALVLVGRAQEDRGQLAGDGAAPNAGVDKILRDALLEDGLGQLVGEHRGGVEQGFVAGLGLVHQVGRDLVDPDVGALGALEVDGLHGHQVDEALELVLQADRELHHHGVVAELLLELVADLERVGADPVALVDEGHPGHVVALELPVDGDRLGLHPAHRTQHEDGPVQHPQRPLDLDGEVDVAGGVDDVDGVAVPLHVGGGRGDGDAALALELHVVHGGAHPVLALDLVDPVDLLAIEQDPLGQGGFARVDVGADADVAHSGNVGRHGKQNLIDKLRRGFLWMPPERGVIIAKTGLKGKGLRDCPTLNREPERVSLAKRGSSLPMFA